MQLSPKKKSGLTDLEVEAQNLVNEPGDSEEEFEVNDELKYEAMLAERKNRRAVSTFLKLYFKFENFLIETYSLFLFRVNASTIS
jgi:hypothetical protein